jgi:hypothetical protein
LLVIQSNIIGLDMAGGFSNQYNGVQFPIMYNSALLIHTSDIIIGGDDPAEGNTIVDQNNIPMNYPGGEGLHFVIETGRDAGMGLLKIKNNRLGTRKDGTLDPAYRLFPVQVYIAGNFKTDYTIEIKDNILHGFIWMNDIGKYFTIQGNTVFTPWTNEVYDCSFTFFNCFGGGIVGGDNPGECNTITNAYTDAYSNALHPPAIWVASVRFDLASHVTMRKNVALCNNYAGSTYINSDAGSY